MTGTAHFRWAGDLNSPSFLTCRGNKSMKTESEAGPDITSTQCRGRPRDERAHQTILEFTRKLAGEKNSYNDITIEAISRGAHVAKTTIYRWWKTKNALVREACFEGRLVAPNTGSLQADIRDVISQEAALHQGPVTRGVLAGFVAEFVERLPNEDAIKAGPKRFLQLTLEDVLHDAELRGEKNHGVDAEEATDLIEMTLYFRCILRGQTFTSEMTDTLLQQIVPAS